MGIFEDRVKEIYETIHAESARTAPLQAAASTARASGVPESKITEILSDAELYLKPEHAQDEINKIYTMIFWRFVYFFLVNGLIYFVGYGVWSYLNWLQPDEERTNTRNGVQVGLGVFFLSVCSLFFLMPRLFADKRI